MSLCLTPQAEILHHQPLHTVNTTSGESCVPAVVGAGGVVEVGGDAGERRAAVLTVVASTQTLAVVCQVPVRADTKQSSACI